MAALAIELNTMADAKLTTSWKFLRENICIPIECTSSHVRFLIGFFAEEVTKPGQSDFLSLRTLES